MNNLSLDMEIVVSSPLNLTAETGTILNTIDHRQMTYRDAAEQHPISAITNLTQTLAGKQETLVSGTNIKTVNGNSVLGSGNIVTPDTTYTEGTAIDISAENVISVDATEISYNDLQDKPTIPTVPTKISAFENDVGYLTQHQDISGKVNRNELKQVAFSGSYADLTGKPTVPTKTSDLTNDSGFITNSALTPYRTAAGQDIIDATKQEKLVSGTNIKTINNTSILGSGNISVGLSTDYIESASVDSTGNQLTLNPHSASPITFAPESGKVDDVTVDGTSVLDGKTAKIVLTGKQDVISDLSTIRANAQAGAAASTEIATYGDIVTHDTDEFATAAQGTLADSALQQSNILNVVTSTSTTDALSANMGKSLQDQITNLASIGRFLAIWDASTGTPTSEPTTSPYTYKVGDYFRIGQAGTKNPAPNLTYTIGGTNWVEGASLSIGDLVYCSNVTSTATVWVKQAGGSGGTVQDVQVNGTSVLSGGIANITSVPTTILNGTVSDSQIASAATWNGKSVVTAATTGTSTTKANYITIDDTEYQVGGAQTEETVTLESDLYAYTPIGKITGASATNPVKVADAGDSLKEVFNAILGTETDSNPTINQGGTTFTKSAQTGTTSASGAEIGQSINAQTGTVTYYVTNTATCSYGLKTASYDTYNKQSATTFNYPIKSRTINSSTYQIRISYPALNGCTLSVTTGTLVYDDTTNRYLYCNVNNENKVTVSIAIPAGTSTSSAQTRFDQLSADVEFDNATYNSETVTNFWTYLKNSYTASGMSHSAITGVKSTAYTITAGTRYAYSAVTSAASAPTTGLTKQSAESTFGSNGADFNYNLGDYIYMYRTTSGRTVETYVLGQWASVTYTALSAVTITQANGATATYYPYQVGPMEATGSAKYRV